MELLIWVVGLLAAVWCAARGYWDGALILAMPVVDDGPLGTLRGHLGVPGDIWPRKLGEKRGWGVTVTGSHGTGKSCVANKLRGCWAAKSGVSGCPGDILDCGLGRRSK